VVDQLRDARLAATGYHTDAVLWAAETQLLTPGTAEHARADSDTRTAEYLAGVYSIRAEHLAVTADARQAWHTVTEPDRTRYELAGDELVRRGLPRDPIPQTADQLALLAPTSPTEPPSEPTRQLTPPTPAPGPRPTSYRCSRQPRLRRRSRTGGNPPPERLGLCRERSAPRQKVRTPPGASVF